MADPDHRRRRLRRAQRRRAPAGRRPRRGRARPHRAARTRPPHIRRLAGTVHADRRLDPVGGGPSPRADDRAGGGGDPLRRHHRRLGARESRSGGHRRGERPGRGGHADGGGGARRASVRLSEFGLDLWRRGARRAADRRGRSAAGAGEPVRPDQARGRDTAAARGGDPRGALRRGASRQRVWAVGIRHRRARHAVADAAGAGVRAARRGGGAGAGLARRFHLLA